MPVATGYRTFNRWRKSLMTDSFDRPPLWEVMYHAFWRCPRENWRLSGAYMIRALRDWLVPEPEEPGFTATDEAFAIWEERKALRILLTAEADRAEKGEVGA
jgi:hypothetical protein